MLQLAGKLCVVVGGGSVGMRKAHGLLEAGARVRLISPRLSSRIDRERVETVSRVFRSGDLDGASLVFAATGDAASDRSVAAEARRLAIPVCLAGSPSEGDFSLPAVLRRGDMTLAVSSSGRSPALVTVVRDQLDALLPESLALVVDIAAAARQHALHDKGSIDYSREALRRLLAGSLLELLTVGNAAGVDDLLHEVFGPSWSLASLGIDLPERNT
jgi:precorrin-2 dehydrogenase/sirohydrochlorin ferrochelatase